jgi:hypothetical protein
MEEGDIRFYAQVQAVLLQAEATKAAIQGMHWENEIRKSRGEAMAYTEADFFGYSNLLATLANDLRSM